MTQKAREHLDEPNETKTALDEKNKKNKGRGFLPIVTNGFDRFFISVVLWVALSLFWLRFLEPLGLSIWIGMAISILFGVYIVRRG